jgi:Fe-S cluster biogenesis protein NfuA
MREKVEVALQDIRRLKGACGGCPMAQLTLKQGIERRLKEKIPEVKSVESVPLGE